MDVDIDLPSNFIKSNIFHDAIEASMVQNGILKKHNVGIYFQKMAKDEMTGLATIPYKEAETLGYLKVDMLHLSLLDSFKSKKQIRELIKKEPNWSLLEDPNIVSQLFQIHNHFEIINRIKPKSVIELADCLALIRPGKRNLIEQYIKSPQKTRKILYSKTADNKYIFKKAHAIAYALTIVLNLHLIEWKLKNVIK